MVNSEFEEWLNSNNYFDDLAVFSFGPLHPGGINASNLIFNKTIWTGKKVLDVGIGNGTTIKYLNSLGADCYGVEKSVFMYKSAIRNGLDKQKLFNVDICNFQTDLLFDVILFEGVIGFLNDPITVIKKIANNLSKDGIILINDWIPFKKYSNFFDESYFNVYGISDPVFIMSGLNVESFNYEFKVYETTSKGISNKSEDIIKRVESYFELKLSESEILVINNKLNKMRSALGSNIITNYYILQIRKKLLAASN